MKKLTALILMLALCAFPAALAETGTDALTTDLGELPITYEENWLVFENGMTMCVPPEWTDMGVTEELAATGIVYMATDASGNVMSLAYANVGVTDIALFATGLAVTYPDAALIKANGVDMVSYTDPAGTYAGLASLDGLGGMYTLIFYPVPTEEFEITAVTIMSTLKAVESAE